MNGYLITGDVRDSMVEIFAILGDERHANVLKPDTQSMARELVKALSEIPEHIPATLEATENTVKILCGCGDLYEYPVHDGVVDVSGDNNCMCANCAIMFQEEQPKQTCHDCEHVNLHPCDMPCMVCAINPRNKIFSNQFTPRTA